mgnify:CR=1 FL=1
MTWSNVLAVESRTQIGVQSAIPTAPSTWKDLVLSGEAIPFKGAKRNMIANTDQRRYRRQYVAPVPGLKSESPVAFECHGKRLSTRLNASATPVAFGHADALSHQILYRAILGGELTPAAGTTEAGAAGSTATVVQVTSAAVFTVGQMVGIEIGSDGVIEWRRVVARDTAATPDTITVFPALSALPTASGEIRNAYCYYPAEGDTQTYAMRHGHVESGTPETHEYHRGITGGGELTLDVGQVVKVAFSGTSVDHDDPTDLSGSGLTMASVADDMGAPLVWQPTLHLHLTTTGTAPGHAQIETLKVTIPRTWQALRGSGGAQGVAGLVETAGRAAPIMIEVSGWTNALGATASAWASLTNGDLAHLIAYTSDGATTAQRFLGLCAPQLRLVEEPVKEVTGALLFVRMKFQVEMDTSITALPTPGSTGEPSIAGLVVFLG